MTYGISILGYEIASHTTIHASSLYDVFSTASPYDSYGSMLIYPLTRDQVKPKPTIYQLRSINLDFGLVAGIAWENMGLVEDRMPSMAPSFFQRLAVALPAGAHCSPSPTSSLLTSFSGLHSPAYCFIMSPP
jgi:hypothetical protein